MEITAVEPLQVALQYRAARRHYRLSETEYLEAASQFESPQALFEYFVSVLKTFSLPKMRLNGICTTTGSLSSAFYVDRTNILWQRFIVQKLKNKLRFF